jgi:hypothetical protein
VAELPTLSVLTLEGLELEVTSSGRLLPWIGPALRGLVAGQMKARICRFAEAERLARWEHCQGCQHIHECSYGLLFEPDPPVGQPVRSGESEVARPLVLAPWFPVPVDAEPGLTVPLKVVVAGTPPPSAIDELLDAVDFAGHNAGLGPDAVGFRLAGRDSMQQVASEIGSTTLPLQVSSGSSVIPRVGIGLTAPMVLRRRDPSGRRRVVDRPSLNDLLRASFRMLGQLSRLYGAGELNADWNALADLAAQVEMVEHCFEPFQQARFSSRGRSRYRLEGVIGGGVYRDVPTELLPWLLWGGRLHVAGHRISGSGGWRIILD